MLRKADVLAPEEEPRVGGVALTRQMVGMDREVSSVAEAGCTGREDVGGEMETAGRALRIIVDSCHRL